MAAQQTSSVKPNHSEREYDLNIIAGRSELVR